jgi:hypothetical protein
MKDNLVDGFMTSESALGNTNVCRNEWGPISYFPRSIDSRRMLYHKIKGPVFDARTLITIAR